MLSVNQDRRISQMLLELKRHFKACETCPGAIKARSSEMLCDHTVALIISIAVRYDTLIPARLQAARDKQNVVYACPDLAAHGEAYRLIAEPLNAVGVQGSLF
jgi:hypothetical protein